MAQMYFYVLRALFQKNSQVMVSGQDILKITRNQADFRDGKELDNGYFFESNIDSNSKFTILKKLLSLFEMEEELIIKYQTGPVNSGEPPRYTIRKKYWLQLLPLLQEINLFQNINASNDQWLCVGAGISGFQYALTNTKSIARVELGIVTSSKEMNKTYFRRLFSKKELIEEALGQIIEWQELPESKMSRIKIELTDVDFFNENEWAKRNDYFLKMFPKFQAAFDPFLKELK